MIEGDFHQVVHIWIMNKKGEFLIQQRQPWKVGWPNMWDCAAAGSVLLGETSESGAIREVKEELGIELQMEHAEVLFTLKFSRGFDDHWLVKQEIDVEQLNLQYEEVADARWATADEILGLVESGDFIPYHILVPLMEMSKSSISLKKASLSDAAELFEIQKKVFQPLYQKYQDHDTSPVFQSFDRFTERLQSGDFFKIYELGLLVGSVHVYPKSPGLMRLHMINILEEFQGKGIAQEVMTRIEGMYPQAIKWELDTIKQEQRNCYLYEKMGYEKTGDEWKVNEQMTLIHYTKTNNLNHLKPIL
ncbi:Isopentenyldiphosphate isomerase [Psychrobacillus sp. OK028]|uniref:bifunctional NUDIX hydrolase family protein/GNAT family N-acetyltransferase n=1 Tax=Psychrobacillus sp. OK028 TaxID=1884359 RepID=UPI00088942A5|nr:bifunctional NUDIX hydrolase family protein/GNAT family N-acetyltransferase [Psychrobacillus sp. OK028]SDO10988.1 Isopentenyldiphosphate isomerase [Psychrobacillus sp. OK028]